MPFPRRCFLALLLLFAVPLPAATGGSDWLYQGSDIARDPAWQMGTLPNGVRYAVRRNPLPAGQVSIRVRIDAGSLNEADNERGWAHFVEHLAFRGTKSYADREARYIWQQFGASFGGDTNASTSGSQTVYQLDLPNADKDSIDKSVKILAEMMDSARFEPAAVDGERKIVMAEKARRSELSVRMQEVLRPLFFGGLKAGERDPIGTDATLAAATPEGLRAFYERWYRPDTTTVVMVGDADPAMMIAEIERHFGSWRASGPKPPAPDYGSIATPPDPIGTLAYPGAPYDAQVVWLRPGRLEPTTVATEREDLAERLAINILNRRLEAKARKNAAFLSASFGTSQDYRSADMSQLAVTSRNGRWSVALREAYAVLTDALRAPPSAAEIARELANARRSIQSAVDGEATTRSPQWAQRMVGAVNAGDVLTTAATRRELLERLAPDMTPQRLDAALKRMMIGSGPRMFMLTPEPADRKQIGEALAAAQKAPPADREPDRLVSFDTLPKLGPPGKEVSRQRIEDMDVTVIRFANGSSLSFKRTDFSMGSVSVQLLFGNGIAGMRSDQPYLGWMTSAVGPSGLADLDLDGLDRLTTGRRMGLSFSVGEEDFGLGGGTNAEDLPDQLRLLALKLAYPRWDEDLFNRYKASWLEGYDLSFASASARAGREGGGVQHPGDRRWQPIEKDTVAWTAPTELKRFFEPLLATGPIDAVIVGDVTLEKAVEAFAATIGALPARPAAGAIYPTLPPKPNPKPAVFTHTGDPHQAYAMIGWTTFGGIDRPAERRALSLGASILQTRLFNRLREEEGVTYSPGIGSNVSYAFADWGVFAATSQIAPDKVDAFLRIAREEIAKMAREPVPRDEFERALNPGIAGIERSRKTNGYWMTNIAAWTRRPEMIEQTRNHLSGYKAVTPDAVRAAMAAYVADDGDWSMIVLPEKKANGD